MTPRPRPRPTPDGVRMKLCMHKLQSTLITVHCRFYPSVPGKLQKWGYIRTYRTLYTPHRPVAPPMNWAFQRGRARGKTQTQNTTNTTGPNKTNTTLIKQPRPPASTSMVAWSRCQNSKTQLTLFLMPHSSFALFLNRNVTIIP